MAQPCVLHRVKLLTQRCSFNFLVLHSGNVISPRKTSYTWTITHLHNIIYESRKGGCKKKTASKENSWTIWIYLFSFCLPISGKQTGSFCSVDIPPSDLFLLCRTFPGVTVSEHPGQSSWLLKKMVDNKVNYNTCYIEKNMISETPQRILSSLWESIF
jgi:hypothetical protein